jgi:hypothetical protein
LRLLFDFLPDPDPPDTDPHQNVMDPQHCTE